MGHCLTLSACCSSAEMLRIQFVSDFDFEERSMHACMNDIICFGSHVSIESMHIVHCYL